jgi:small subunit ribosomal protein S8
MGMTDPIADMLTRIRNANMRKFESVLIPASNLKNEILKVIKNEGYIADYSDVVSDGKDYINVILKYKNKKESAIRGITRISKPGIRTYAKANELPRVLGGLGIAIISTSQGIMTDKKARKANLGGEVIAFVW